MEETMFIHQRVSSMMTYTSIRMTSNRGVNMVLCSSIYK